MPSRSQVKGIPGDLRSETAILAAVAREALLDCHVRHAVDLVELGRGRVQPDRMLEVYARLHFLDVNMYSDIRGRALAALGDRAIRYAVISPVSDTPEPPVVPPPRTLWTRIRSQFRQRVHHSLRRDVDRHTGRSEIELMEVHTEHALRFARALEKRFTMAEAVRIYSEAVSLRDTLRETLYLLVISRFGDPWPEPSMHVLPDSPGQLVMTH